MAQSIMESLIRTKYPKRKPSIVKLMRMKLAITDVIKDAASEDSRCQSEADREINPTMTRIVCS